MCISGSHAQRVPLGVQQLDARHGQECPLCLCTWASIRGYAVSIREGFGTTRGPHLVALTTRNPQICGSRFGTYHVIRAPFQLSNMQSKLHGTMG